MFAQRHMRFGKALILILAASVLAMIFAPAASASPGDLHIFPPTVTEMETEMGESVVYRWGIYNNGTHPNPHTLLVDIDGGNMGWEATLSNEDSYIYIEGQEFISIELTVTAPKTRDYPESAYTLRATVRDLVTKEEWTREMGSVNTSISGGAYIPPTKVLGWFDEPLGDFIPFLDNEWGVFITTVIVWLIIGLVIYFILDPVVKGFAKNTKTTMDDEILAIVKGPVFWLILAYGVVSSLRVLNLPWTIINGVELLYSSLVIVLIGWMAYKIFKDFLVHWARRYCERTETTLDDVMLPLFEKVGMIIIVLVAIVLTLNLFGVDVTMLLAGMGIIGLVIAFAAQDTLGNFISGMFLLTDRPFKVGDLVLMENGDYCRVENIGMRSTKLYNTFDHDMIILPNSKIANEKVINLTEPDNKMKVKITIGVSYDSDIDKAKSIMVDVANNHPLVLHTEGKTPFARVIDFADSSVNIWMLLWVDHLDNQWKVAGEIREGIFKRFKEEGIEIPFPQRVVHMKGEPGNKSS